MQLGSKPAAPYLNVRVSNDSARAHSEPEIAENPNNPLDLVGGSKFFTDPARYAFNIGYYYSMDGGCTWTDGGLLPGFKSPTTTSDITFAFGPNNRVYAAVLDTDNQNQSGVSVSTSTDGGRTFGLPVHVYNNTDGTIFSDKPWIGVSPRDGSIVVVWSYDHQEPVCNDPNAAQACPQELGFAKSTDGGLTFSPVRQVEGTAPFCTNPADTRPANTNSCDAVLGATPAFLPDGTLAVAYAYVDLGATSTITIPTRMIVLTSSDGGDTWNTPVLVATIHDIPSPFPGLKFRNFSLPAFAADPRTNHLYIAWADSRNDPSDIYLSSSSDDGQSWSAPVRVNDDTLGNGALQFQPQLAVAPDGVVSVAFFDTRYDPQHKLIDETLAQSLDHGQTFLPNVRVTTQSWDSNVDLPLDFNHNGFIGDYQGLSADDHFVHPFWNDTRTGSQEIFTAAVPSAQPAK